MRSSLDRLLDKRRILLDSRGSAAVGDSSSVAATIDSASSHRTLMRVRRQISARIIARVQRRKWKLQQNSGMFRPGAV